MVDKQLFKKQVYEKYQEELEKNDRKQVKLSKMAVSFMVCLVLISGIVYASVNFEKLFKINGMDDTGIQKAVENQYVQNIDMDYIQKEDVKFKVDYLMMDDINFDLVFNFVTKDCVENYEGIALYNLRITDENNSQIHFAGENQEIWSKNIAPFDAWWSVVEKHDKLMRQVVHFSSDHFPRSQKIYVSFDKVTLYNVNHGNPFTVEYEDDYQLEFDVSQQLVSRKTIEYQTNEPSIYNVKLTNSGLALTMKTDHYILRDEDYKMIDEAGNEYTLSDVLPVIDETIMDYKRGEHILIFNFTMYDECRSLKLKYPDGKIVDLERK